MSSYHDYVIKDGKLIGQFEEMYQKFDDPWMQSDQPNQYSRTMAIMNIKRYKISSLIEVGCGLGYYANRIHQETGIIPYSIDISPTAIEKAKTLFPQLNFHVDTLANLHALPNKSSYDCILLADVTWYILEQLKDINDMLLTHFKGKYLINNFVTYKGTQLYGKEYFTTTKEYIDYMPFKFIGYGEATTIDDHNIDSTTIFKIEQK